MNVFFEFFNLEIKNNYCIVTSNYLRLEKLIEVSLS